MAEGPKERQKLEGERKEFRWWWFVIGVTSSTVSLISLVQTATKVGLWPVFDRFLQFYRNRTYPIIDFAASHLYRPLTDWEKDWFILSFIVYVIYVRAVVRFMERRTSAGTFARTAVLLVGVVVSAALSLLPYLVVWFVISAGLSIYLASYIRRTHGDDGSNPLSLSALTGEPPRLFLIGLGIVAASTVVFFVFNAFVN